MRARTDLALVKVCVVPVGPRHCKGTAGVHYHHRAAPRSQGHGLRSFSIAVQRGSSPSPWPTRPPALLGGSGSWRRLTRADDGPIKIAVGQSRRPELWECNKTGDDLSAAANRKAWGAVGDSCSLGWEGPDQRTLSGPAATSAAPI